MFRSINGITDIMLHPVLALHHHWHILCTSTRETWIYFIKSFTYCSGPIFSAKDPHQWSYVPHFCGAFRMHCFPLLYLLSSWIWTLQRTAWNCYHCHNPTQSSLLEVHNDFPPLDSDWCYPWLVVLYSAFWMRTANWHLRLYTFLKNLAFYALSNALFSRSHWLFLSIRCRFVGPYRKNRNLSW